VPVLADVPAARPAGAMTDVVAVSWLDRNGNHYGPVSASFTTTVRVVPPDPGADLTLGPAPSFRLPAEMAAVPAVDSGWVTALPAGRLLIDATELTVVLASGMPLTVLRRYDSLLADQQGDFGHGWSLVVEPRLEVQLTGGVTILLPYGQRVAFAFTPQAYSPLLASLRRPSYTAQAPGTGTLTSNGCSLLAMDGSALSGGSPLCFLDGGLEYRPTSYVYADAAGRSFRMAATGALATIDDRAAGTLAVGPAGIAGSAGEPSVAVERDKAGRVLRIVAADGSAYRYSYDAAGDLAAVTLPQGGLTVEYAYDAAHRLRATRDPRALGGSLFAGAP
jgi:YD repeat-containing protein